MPLATLQTDRAHAKAVGEILHSANRVKTLNITLNNNDQFSKQTIIDLLGALNDNTGSIYLLSVTQNRNPNRHAEEFLTDIVEFAKGTGQPVYSCIAGKKRPCLGCSGRMQGVVDQYSKKPGLFWMHTLEFQSETAAAKTLNVLLTESPRTSLNKDGVKSFRDYDSGSDSECDETENDSSDNDADIETSSISSFDSEFMKTSRF